MERESTMRKDKRTGLFEKIGDFVEKRSNWIIWGTIIVTTLLLFPIFFLAPSERASMNATGEVYDLADRIGDEFPKTVHRTSFIVESKEDDMLTQASLWELYQNEQELRNSDIGRTYLYSSFDVEAGVYSPGIYTIADAVWSFFEMDNSSATTLENANDEEVKIAINWILMDPISSAFKDSFSQKAEKETREINGQMIDLWSSPVIVFQVNLDNSKFPDGASVTEGGSVEHQETARDIQKILRGDEQNFKLYGIAIDVDLESEEEGMLVMPLLIAAIILIIAVVAIQFKSWRLAVLTVLGLVMIIIWMKGLANLVGLKASLILDIILPIAILVLGVDYIIHSIHRYEEERAHEKDPAKALGKGIIGVGAAMALAMLTTFVAFVSNTTSDIEETRGFSIGASLAILSAFFIMGFFIPILFMKWEAHSLKKQAAKKEEDRKSFKSKISERGFNRIVSGSVIYAADHKFITLSIVALITLGSGYLLTQLETEMDVKDYFDSSSDFIVSLDLTDEHLGDSSGEEVKIYISGDLTDPEALSAIQSLILNIQDDESFTISADTGEVDIDTPLFDFLNAVMESNLTMMNIKDENPGLNITDEDGDMLPDTTEQLDAVYSYIIENGIHLNETLDRYDGAQIRESFYRKEGSYDATVIKVYTNGIMQEDIKNSEKELKEDLKALDVDSISYYHYTGSGIMRNVMIEAIVSSLTISIFIAAILCLIIIVIALRSIKFSIVTVIPVLLVAVWLYGFMHLIGYQLNYVTAIIAAISIGVGVDYSVHITSRYLEERKKTDDRDEALKQTTLHSGAALFGSALSTFLGFIILAFAPMPMFAAFGLLTAFMILMALIAALFVLPAMIMVVDWQRNKKEGSK